jgi:hypothetical protein
MINYNTSIYGSKGLDYVKALVGSILAVHPEGGCTITISHSDLDVSLLEPFEKIPEVRLLESTIPISLTEKDSRKTISSKMLRWTEIVEKKLPGARNVLLDMDTIVLKDPSAFFSEPFDLLFTYKTFPDEGLKWPLNSGVVLFGEDPVELFREWRDQTMVLVNDTSLLNEAVKRWGGADQAALARVATFEHGRMEFPLQEVGGFMIKGVPCAMLNETRCVPITKDTHIVHYKGSWRNVLPHGKFYATRPKNKCLEMFNIWKDNLRRFRETYE